MFKVFYPNPTIDKTIILDRFKIGGTNRPIGIFEEGAGKPLNLANMLSILGSDPELKGFVFDKNDEAIISRLKNKNIAHSLLSYPGSARVNTKIFDSSKSEITEINESGDEISPEFADELYNSFICSVDAASDFVVLAGSQPKHKGENLYKRIIDFCSENAVPFFIDAEGSSLQYAIKHNPFLIKPNKFEFELLSGRAFSNINEIVIAAYAYIEKGVKNVCVSLGAEGAVLVNSSGAYYALPPKLNIVSTVGAGDAMSAGLLYALYSSSDSVYALSLGTACSCAQISRMLDNDTILSFHKNIVVEHIHIN